MNNQPIYAEDETGRLVPMSPAAPPDEDELQALIADHPDIVGEAEGELLFIARESGIPDADGAAVRWAIDHLFVTRGAVPVLLEVKRATDTRLRREVVGQLLDYAANGSAYWPAGTLEDAFRATSAAQGQDPGDRLAAFLGEAETAGFWGQVEANLAAGRLRLVIAADVIPPELARVIEFLNDQMRAEVRGVELRYFRSAGGRRTLVPRIVGQTERAKVVKGDGSRPTPSVSVDAWLAQITEERGTPFAEPARRLIDLVVTLGASLSITAANSVAVAFPGGAGGPVKPMHLTRRGRIEFSLGSLARVPALADPAVRQAWLDKVEAQVGGLSHPRADGWPRLPLDRLTGERWDAFAALLRDLVAMMRAA